MPNSLIEEDDANVNEETNQCKRPRRVALSANFSLAGERSHDTGGRNDGIVPSTCLPSNLPFCRSSFSLSSFLIYSSVLSIGVATYFALAHIIRMLLDVAVRHIRFEPSCFGLRGANGSNVVINSQKDEQEEKRPALAFLRTLSPLAPLLCGERVGGVGWCSNGFVPSQNGSFARLATEQIVSAVLVMLFLCRFPVVPALASSPRCILMHGKSSLPYTAGKEGST